MHATPAHGLAGRFDSTITTNTTAGGWILVVPRLHILCRRRASNPHADSRLHKVLSLACLPIPSHRQESIVGAPGRTPGEKASLRSVYSRMPSLFAPCSHEDTPVRAEVSDFCTDGGSRTLMEALTSASSSGWCVFQFHHACMWLFVCLFVCCGMAEQPTVRKVGVEPTWGFRPAGT